MSLYNSKPISGFQLGDEVRLTDYYIGVDTTDDTQSPVGSTKKYTIQQLVDRFNASLIGSNVKSAKAVSVTNLSADYNNGDDGVGATLTNNSAFAVLSIDNVLLSDGDRVLVSNQADAVQNGVYVVTDAGSTVEPWILTRADDYDNHIEGQIEQGDFIGVTLGDNFKRTFWFQIADSPIVVGTDDIIFEQQTIAIFPTEIWNYITTTPQSLDTNSAYIIDTLPLCELTLPVTSSRGDIIKIQGRGSGLFRILQGASQIIHLGSASTTVTTGYLESTDSKDSLSLLCLTDNTEWVVNGGAIGDFTLT